MYRLSALLLVPCIVAWSPFLIGGGDQVTPAPPPPPSFVTLAASDLSALSIPTVYEGSPVDTSGWPLYDVICESDDGGCTADAGSTAKFPAAWGCAPLNNAGTADNSTNLECMLLAMSDDELLFFPDGTYDIGTALDGNSFFRPRPAYDNRGMVFESHSAIINVTGVYPTDGTLVFLEAEDAVWNAVATSWNGGSGSSAGTTVIPVAATTGFPTTPGAAGHWVVLTADPNSTQDNAGRVYRSTVSAINAGVSITIDHPLPEDFDGGSALARAWTPTENWVLRDGTFQFESPLHLSHQGINFNASFKNVATLEISGMQFLGGMRQYLNFEDTADVYIVSNDMTGTQWDKASNGFALIFSGSSRPYFFDNYTEHVTGLAMSGGTEEPVIILNHFAAMPANASFDAICTEGDGNDCTIIDHSGDHATTVGTAYLHCSGNESDALGLNGDPSCRGTAASVTYSGIEYHDASSSTSLIMRNFFEAPIWFDNNNGNGVDNFFFGNWFGTSPRALFNTSPGGKGDFHFRDTGGSPPASYVRTDIWANNVFDGAFGSGSGWNPYCDGCQVLDNIMRTTCQDRDSGVEDPDDGDCSHLSSGLTAGTNVTWTSNTVGADVHSGYSRTMPSLPGFTAWPTFKAAGTGDAPWVGPEKGDPDLITDCLPAGERNGAC